MKQALIQALNAYRVYDIVYEYKNQNNVLHDKKVEYILIDDIVNSIKLFNRYHQSEQEQKPCTTTRRQ